MSTSTAPQRSLFGLDVDAMTTHEVVDLASARIASRERLMVGVINAAKIVNSRSDPFLRDSLECCDVLLADGQSVVWASRLLHRPLPERVAGIDLFERLLELANEQKSRIYLLGATREVLAATVSNIQDRWPDLQVAGSHDGYFTDRQAAFVAAKIRAAQPDMLFLGMSSPKKEIFLAAFGQRLGAPVLHGVGGSFDIMAGVTRRAPKIWQKAGMEWAFRLVQEPKRMWRRYLNTNTRFMILVAQEMTRQRKHPGMVGSARP